MSAQTGAKGTFHKVVISGTDIILQFLLDSNYVDRSAEECATPGGVYFLFLLVFFVRKTQFICNL
jgi:hypothetical protein